MENWFSSQTHCARCEKIGTFGFSKSREIFSHAKRTHIGHTFFRGMPCQSWKTMFRPTPSRDSARTKSRDHRFSRVARRWLAGDCISALIQPTMPARGGMASFRAQDFACKMVFSGTLKNLLSSFGKEKWKWIQSIGDSYCSYSVIDILAQKLHKIH